MPSAPHVPGPIQDIGNHCAPAVATRVFSPDNCHIVELTHPRFSCPHSSKSSCSTAIWAAACDTACCLGYEPPTDYLYRHVSDPDRGIAAFIETVTSLVHQISNPHQPVVKYNPAGHRIEFPFESPVIVSSWQSLNFDGPS